MSGETTHFGALMERGRVLEAAEGKCRLESISRPGVTTPMLPMMTKETVKAGDIAFFCLFDDGKGIVLAKMSE